MDNNKRPYLRIGEHVKHEAHPEWGDGVVVEILDSAIPGGVSMVKIEFTLAGQKFFSTTYPFRSAVIMQG